MISESLRAFWVAKSRECGASWEKVDEIWRLLGFFKQKENERKRETKNNNNNKNNTKKNKTKQTDINISLLYLSTRIHK